jgi:metallo-beta-lactamase family protein
LHNRDKFLGATKTVTGSKYLLEHNRKKTLVDCGLFQGLKELRLRNWSELPINVSKLDYIVLTHAHIDHSGFIPRLVKQGFRGKIYCTPPTRDLCKVLLPDCGYLQEEAARYANKRGYSKHHPALPLYTFEDAQDSLRYFRPVEYKKIFELGDGLTFEFRNAGHILGSANVTISDGSKSITFSGDVGRPEDPILYPPDLPNHTDYLVIESTYGNRTHPKSKPTDELADVINNTSK